MLAFGVVVLSILIGLIIVFVTVVFVFPALRPRPRLFWTLALANGVLVTWGNGWSLSWLWDWHPWALAVAGLALLQVARVFRPALRARRKERREERRLAQLEAELEHAECRVAVWSTNEYVAASFTAAERDWTIAERDRARQAAVEGGLSKNRIEGAKAHAVGRVLGEREDARISRQRDMARTAS